MIEVKNVKIYDSLSEETLCFTATVYKNGKRIGTAKNTGHGGSTDVRLDNGDFGDTALENAVDDAVYAFDSIRQLDKIHKKIQRDSKKYICVGKIGNGGATYKGYGFQRGLDLATVALSGEEGLRSLQNLVDKVKASMKEDESILNRNLEALGVEV